MNESLENFKVLDSGRIELLSVMGSDLEIVNAAKVSFLSSATEMDQSSIGLLNYLLKNKHATPFEHVMFKFRIKCPIFVAREWFRHRWSSFNEMSMRYHIPKNIEFYIPDEHCIRQQIGKPGSYQFQQIADDRVINNTKNLMMSVYEMADSAYRALIADGVAKEIARAVLPVGQYTEFIWTVNARSLLNFLNLRNSEHAQYEIREYAKIIEEQILVKYLPLTYQSFISNGREQI